MRAFHVWGRIDVGRRSNGTHRKLSSPSPAGSLDGTHSRRGTAISAVSGKLARPLRQCLRIAQTRLEPVSQKSSDRSYTRSRLTAMLTPLSVSVTSTTVTSEQSDLLTASEVAELFRVTPRTISRWANAGLLERVRVGGISRYPLAAVEELLHPENAMG